MLNGNEERPFPHFWQRLPPSDANLGFVASPEINSDAPRIRPHANSANAGNQYNSSLPNQTERSAEKPMTITPALAMRIGNLRASQTATITLPGNRMNGMSDSKSNPSHGSVGSMNRTSPPMLAV